MPYGYYQLIRIISLISFAILAYNAFNYRENYLVITYAGLWLLFQPFIKVELQREVWNIIDILVAALLVFSIFIFKNREEKKS